MDGAPPEESEEIDIDRVVFDAEYRRRVIARLRRDGAVLPKIDREPPAATPQE